MFKDAENYLNIVVDAAGITCIVTRNIDQIINAHIIYYPWSV